MDKRTRSFLNVEDSLTNQRWVERLDRVGLGHAETMSEEFGIEPQLARVMAGRGVLPQDALAHLKPTLRDLMPDPSSLTDMDRAVDRLVEAVKSNEQVAVFGDYDVDGATSSALLAKYLRACGLQVEIYIPDRIFEGYGPNESAISELVENGAQLIVTVDCGSTSFDALAHAKSIGVETLVIDHHQVAETLPDTVALVNPNRHDDLSGQGHLCAAGVVFMTLVALNRALREDGLFDQRDTPDLMQWLDLVALGTVCDVVPLQGLNRAFVLRGIEVMQKQRSPGLTALAKVARQDGPAAPWHLGFLLGPRINAGGRIGDASLGARLLTSDDPAEAQSIAEQLDMLNSERQAMETAMLDQAVNEAEAEIGLGDGPNVLITQSNTWHAGVVGLLASRLKDRFRRPAFAISFDHRDIGSGSGRSIAGVDIGAAVRAAVEDGLLTKGGGHAMAAGITIERAKLADFRAYMEKRLGEVVSERRDNEQVKIDSALSTRGATPEFVTRLEQAGPYGAGNAQPVFAFPNHVLRHASRVGANHVRFTIGSPDGASLDGISFRTADTPLGEALLEARGESMHFVGTLAKDFYRGTTRVQLRLIDAAPAPNPRQI
ncbi:MAG: single-stranded-DNA-specific exonuclease RecJ [Pseudomonadota bacterium]